jgi:hypothetical protein
MNRLLYNRVYLAGPIDFAPDHGCGWREQIQQDLRGLGIIFLNPCHKPMFPGYECPDLEDIEVRMRLKKEHDWIKLGRNMRALRCVDLRMCDICDFSILHLDLNQYSTGSHEELTTLNRRKAPILFHMEQGQEAVPDWVRGELPPELIFDDWKQLIQYVNHIAFDEQIDTLGRWHFFDYASLIRGAQESLTI